MECEKAKGLIQEKLAGALNAKVQGGLNAHLQGCRECRAFGAGLEKLDALLAGEPLREVPAGFSRRVVEAARRRQVKALSFERRNMWAGAACAAAAVVVLAILPFLVELPQAAVVAEEIAAAVPRLPETSQITDELAAILPELPQSVPTLSGTISGVEVPWRSFSEISVPSLALTGTFMLLLGAFATAAAGLEAVYLALPYWRKR